MTILVDTSVWSLALRRDAAPLEPEAQVLTDALQGDEVVVTTRLVLQELLQGFSGPKAQTQIVQRFAALPLLQLASQETGQQTLTNSVSVVNASAPPACAARPDRAPLRAH